MANNTDIDSPEKKTADVPRYVDSTVRPTPPHSEGTSGVPADILIRGSTQGHEFTTGELARISKFYIGAKNFLLKGAKKYPLLVQKDAHSPREEEVRDEALHMLGQILNFDVEGAVNACREEITAPLSEFYRGIFGYPESEYDQDDAYMTVSNFRFNLPDQTDRTFLLQELEIDVIEHYDGFSIPNVYRLIGLFAEENSEPSPN